MIPSVTFSVGTSNGMGAPLAASIRTSGTPLLPQSFATVK